MRLRADDFFVSLSQGAEFILTKDWQSWFNS